jgi:phosphatidate cytidylyltransferase
LFLPLLLLIELFRNRGSAFLNLGSTVLGVFYVSFFFGSLIGLRELFVAGDFPFHRFFDVHGISIPDEVVAQVYKWGGMTVIALFVSVWVCDSAAYFAGRAFGAHKLFERVSPKKTWEGAVAGVAGAVAAFVAAKFLVLPYLSVTSAVICGIIVGVIGQLGDLVESLLKRDAGVKDSSALIPGHGGVLDRFDSILFSAPIIYFYLDFVVCQM